MKKIQQISLIFRILFQIAFFILPIFLVVSWIQAPKSLSFFGHMIVFNSIPHHYPILYTLGWSTKLLGFLISLIPTTVSMFTLYFLIKLFKLYERNEIFSLSNVKYIRNVAYTLLIGQFINPIYEFFVSMIITWHNPEHSGLRYASITFDQGNIGIIIIAVLVILISWIMAEGYKLKEEQQLII